MSKKDEDEGDVWFRVRVFVSSCKFSVDLIFFKRERERERECGDI